MGVLELADRLWRGETDTEAHNPVSATDELEEVSPGVAFVASLANISAFGTDEGLVLVDTGSKFFAANNHAHLRRWTDKPLHTAVFSHGHIDHVFGVGPFEEEADANRWRRPRVVAHEAMPHRFDRYVMTAGYNAVINQRQFQVPGMRWPTEYRHPDETYRDHLRISVGGVAFELHHARGETDDHTWTWIPEHRVLCPGDLFIWATPNAGNPQKVQRYAREWAIALRRMVALEPEVMLPGHGWPVVGADRVRQALTDTADLLDHLHDETVRMMNDGARLDDILHTVKAPDHLIAQPYLRPVYDEPEFIVRNVWRLYGGWYDGNPARLKPAPDAVLAAEVAALAGGAQRLAARGAEIAETSPDDEGGLRLACHLVEMAAQAAPDDAGVHAVRAQVFQRRADREISTMSRGVFSWAVRESRDVTAQPLTEPQPPTTGTGTGH